jgi:hypothetical protein
MTRILPGHYCNNENCSAKGWSRTVTFVLENASPSQDHGSARRHYDNDNDDRAAELEAMGGDPFFLTDDEDENDFEQMQNEEDEPAPSLSSEFMMAAAMMTPTSPVNRFVTDGLGPTPRKKEEKVKRLDDGFEWDGTVDEDAHLGLDDF